MGASARGGGHTGRRRRSRRAHQCLRCRSSSCCRRALVASPKSQLLHPGSADASTPGHAGRGAGAGTAFGGLHRAPPASPTCTSAQARHRSSARGRAAAVRVRSSPSSSSAASTLPAGSRPCPSLAGNPKPLRHHDTVEGAEAGSLSSCRREESEPTRTTSPHLHLRPAVSTTAGQHCDPLLPA